MVIGAQKTKTVQKTAPDLLPKISTISDAESICRQFFNRGL